VTADLPALRSRLGESTALWAREVEVEDGRWRAFSGAFSPRYNLALCHGAGVLGQTLEEIAAAGRPAIVMVTGAAREELPGIELGDWVPLAEMPFMERPSAPADSAGARRLAGEEIADARALIADVFGLHDRLALVALPADIEQRAGQAVWGTFDADRRLASCVISVGVGDHVAIWSLATAEDRRRQGHATRVMLAALTQAARPSLLYAPESAEAFYRSLGYEVLEHWQLWTRRRWRGA
jgi:GNAT superfamily N-acetyltransferase